MTYQPLPPLLNTKSNQIILHPRPIDRVAGSPMQTGAPLRTYLSTISQTHPRSPRAKKHLRP